MKSWKVQLVDDGLEENHETFTVTLKTPHNAVLGQQSSASVEILDPRGGRTQTQTRPWTWTCSGGPTLSLSLPGRCSHQDLQPGGTSRKATPPATQGAEPVADIEAELVWEDPATHHPRGDVPDRRPLPQDQGQKDHQPGVTGVAGVTGSRLVKVSPCFQLLQSKMFEDLMVH